MFTDNSALGFKPSPQSSTLMQMLAVMLNNPMVGSTVHHFQAQHAGEDAFNRLGQPEYLAADAGVYESGVQYVPNPSNPLRGIFCRAKVNPYQDKGGIYFQGEFTLYLANDPGEVFRLDDNKPKRQDRFDIAGMTYYATAPVFPCQMGDTVAAFQIPLSRERYPVRTDNGF